MHVRLILSTCWMLLELHLTWALGITGLVQKPQVYSGGNKKLWLRAEIMNLSKVFLDTWKAGKVTSPRLRLTPLEAGQFQTSIKISKVPTRSAHNAKSASTMTFNQCSAPRPSSQYPLSPTCWLLSVLPIDQTSASEPSAVSVTRSGGMLDSLR